MFTVEDILKATDAKLIKKSSSTGSYGISIDTRTIMPEEVFLAIEGKVFNGHDFLNEALKKGAAGCIISEDKLSKVADFNNQRPFFLIAASNTYNALGNLAGFHRKKFNIPIVGITGSNGKTTTKDLIASILSEKLNVLKTPGTQNNLIGISLALLKLNSKHQACVLEMGTNFPGEIREIAKIAKPNIGIITNIGPSHLEFLKDLQTVYQEKSAIFTDFEKQDLAIWNGDDPMLADLFHLSKCRSKTFGLRPECDFSASEIKSKEDGFEFLVNDKFKARINILAEHNIYNALCAIAVASEFDIDIPKALEALASFKSPQMRMQLLEVKDILIINDCYNSNPKSMKSAISTLSGFKDRRKILVSGDMLELGEASAYFHHHVGKEAAENSIDIFIGVGELSKEAVQAALKAGMDLKSVLHCENSTEAGRLLLKIVKPKDVVLIKGSRAIKMEQALECFTTYSTR